ncbi:hypothetical protein [Mesorhizobium sp. WSM4906]|uniref:hypothetical protein n=1 Tax=Mesorhizobium sp. WSM4906 TaxID=3038546 RepID=UPI002415E2E3|nr:hypothetical protein [Mesorhizobium sp. WSM4906]WFP76565.1 hypothetical protein QAZ22_01555 [Mesorhizobium sp. WSM4906]
MLIFSRRTIQKLIDTAGSRVARTHLERLATNVDRHKRSGIPDVWEIYLLVGHILAHGAEHERPLRDGKKPDIHLPRHQVYTDVKTISDDNAHNVYPVNFFVDTFMDQVARRLPVLGDFHIDFGSKLEMMDGQSTYVPALPDKSEISRVTKDIVIELRRLGGDFSAPFAHEVQFGGVTTRVSFKPSRPGFPLIGSNYTSFTTLRSGERSVATRALDEGSDQLASAPEESLKGVYLCDGGTDLWTKGTSYRTSPIHGIARDYLSKSSKLDFIALFTVQESYEAPERSGSQFVLLPPSLLAGQKRRYIVSYDVIAKTTSTRDQIEGLVREALSLLDPPVQNIGSAYANRMRVGSSIGFRNGMATYGENMIRIPARSLGEILAGGSAAEVLDGAVNSPLRVLDMFARFHREGRTIKKIELVDGHPQDDDWIDITFGPRDPAVSPLRVGTDKDDAADGGR